MGNRRPLGLHLAWPRGNRFTLLVVGMLLAGLALTGMTAMRWQQDEERRNTEQLTSLTSLQRSFLNAAVLRYGDLLGTLAAFEAQSDHDAESYQRFVATLRLEWQTGIDNTGYIEPSSDGTARVAYTSPYPSQLGDHDLLSDAERRVAMERAVDLAIPVVGPVGLLPAHPARDRDGVDVMEIYAAVYGPGPVPATVEERRAETVGWVALTLDLQEVVSTLATSDAGLDMAVYADDGTFIAENAPGAAGRIDTAALNDSVEVATGSRNLVLRTAFAPGRVAPSAAPWVVAVGLLITALVSYALVTTVRHRKVLEAQAEDARQRADLMTSHFHAAVDDAPVGVLVTDLAGNVELFNERLRRLVGAPPDAQVSIFDYLLPENRDDVVTSLTSIALGEQDRVVSERQLRRHDGTLLWCRLSAAVLRQADGEPTGVVAHVQDIESERRAAEELRSRERWFSAIVEHAQDLIVLIDRDWSVKWASPWVERLFDLGPGELAGRPVLDTIHPEDRHLVEAALREAEVGRPARVEYRLTLPSGDDIWMESTTTDRLDDPDVSAIITVSRDVTAQHRSTQDLAHRAAHDPLTGLLNRAELERRLEGSLESAAAASEQLTLAFLDIDHFKDINDAHGHQVGDRVLRWLAESIEAEVRGHDLVSRLGGDEMVIALVGADLTTATAVVERIRRRLRHGLPGRSATTPLTVTVSIGLAVAIGGDTVSGILHRADLALYEAKHQGRNRFAVFTDALAHEEHRRDDLHDDLVLDLNHLPD